MSTINKGAGLLNMQSRAELIKMDYELLSQPGNGVTLKMIYYFND